MGNPKGPPPSTKAAAKNNKEKDAPEEPPKTKDDSKKPEETGNDKKKSSEAASAAPQPSRRDSIEAANTLTGLASTIGRPPTLPPPFMYPHQQQQQQQQQQAPQDEFQAALQMAKLKPSRASTARLPPKAPPTKVTWTLELDQELREAVLLHGYDNWTKVGADMKLEPDECRSRWMYITGRSAQEIDDPYALLRPETKKKKTEDEEDDESSKGRKKRSRWTTEEDDQLKKLVDEYGSGSQSWMIIAEKMPGRRSNQIRDRWVYHLDPIIDKKTRNKPFTLEEDLTILRCLATVGTKWAVMQRMMPSRNDLQIRNHFNSALRKYQRKMARSDESAKNVTVLTQERLLDLETVDLEQFLIGLRSKVTETQRSEIHILVDKLKTELKKRQVQVKNQAKRKIPTFTTEWGIGSPQMSKKAKTNHSENVMNDTKERTATI